MAKVLGSHQEQRLIRTATSLRPWSFPLGKLAVGAVVPR